MGLDMYLKAKRYIGYDDEDSSNKVANIFKDIKIGKPKEVVFEVAYWRKANHIHNWFVENIANGVDDCLEHWVRVEDLKELLDVCNQVLADHTLAEKLLPTKGGFFFGSLEYDECYIEDVRYTQEILSNLLSEENLSKYVDFYYKASW